MGFEEHTEINPSSFETDNEEWKEGIAEKFWACIRVVKKIIETASPEYGEVRNMALTGRLFYYATFHPEAFPAELLEGAKPTDVERINQGLGLRENLISEEEFVTKFRHVMTNEMPSEEFVYPGALESVREMAESGPVVVWTKGDVRGIPALSIPGSGEQLKKIARSGLNDLRHELTAEGKSLSFIAAEDKMSGLATLIPELERQGIQVIVVIDDRASNLLQLKEKAQALGVHEQVILVLDREWEVTQPSAAPRIPKSYNGNVEEFAREHGIVTVNSISEVVGAVTPALKDLKPTWIVDYDDVLSDDTQKSAVTEEKLVSWMTEFRNQIV